MKEKLKAKLLQDKLEKQEKEIEDRIMAKTLDNNSSDFKAWNTLEEKGIVKTKNHKNSCLNTKDTQRLFMYKILPKIENECNKTQQSLKSRWDLHKNILNSS